MKFPSWQGRARVALGPASWRTSKLKKSYKRKKDMILTKVTFIFMQKGTTFINTCCFSFDLELTLVHTDRETNLQQAALNSKRITSL